MASRVSVQVRLEALVNLDVPPELARAFEDGDEAFYAPRVAVRLFGYGLGSDQDVEYLTIERTT